MALAHKHLDIDVTFARQSPAKWQAFEQEVRSFTIAHRKSSQLRLLLQALKAQPQFSTKFEGAWPLRVYMKRYLAKKRPRPHADSQHPHQITHKLSSPKATTPRLSEVRSEVSRIVRYTLLVFILPICSVMMTRTGRVLARLFHQ